MKHTQREAGGGRSREPLVYQSWEAIAKGSKSFAAASMLFDLDTREKVWLLYAWCRHCDDIVDGQAMGGQLGDQSDIAERFTVLRILTQAALKGQPTADLAFDAYGQVAWEAGLTMEDAEEVIAGFELDSQDWRPRTQDDLMRYCYYVAGAVGLMMAYVMGVDREDTETLDTAVDLGISFQLANIARDVIEDDEVGRCYIPAEWLVEEDIEPGQHTKPHRREQLARLSARLIDLMEVHDAHAKMGIAKLTFRQRWALYTAARIYNDIGRKVRAKGKHAWNSRVYTTRWEKVKHVFGGFREALDNWPPETPKTKRWTRARLPRKPKPHDGAAPTLAPETASA
jgi:phytoene synthase